MRGKKRGVLSLVVFLLVIFVLGAWGCARNIKSDEPRTPKEEPKAEQPVGYVGSSRCGACHPNQFDAWENTLHRRMVQDAKKANVIKGDFTKAGNPFEVAKDVKQQDIVYTLGSEWKQRYLIKQGDDFRILPAEWIVATKSWNPYHAEDWDKRAWEDLCIACHTTGYNAKTGEFKDSGIGCEACHGPGEKHVGSRDKADIVNPKNLEFERQVEVCGSCHYRGKNKKEPTREDALGFKPGDNIAEWVTLLEPKPGEETDAFFADGASKKHHQQYQDYIQSKHYTSKKVTCTTCHDPHKAEDPVGEPALKKPLDELCTACHREGGLAAALPTPIDIDKYMPKRAKSATEQDIRSHTFKPGQTETIPKKPYQS